MTAPSAIAWRGAESLVKEMDGLKLDSFLSKKGDAHHPTSHTATGKPSTNILDFDNDSDGVFEDDDAMLPSDSNHGAGKKTMEGRMETKRPQEKRIRHTFRHGRDRRQGRSNFQVQGRQRFQRSGRGGLQ